MKTSDLLLIKEKLLELEKMRGCCDDDLDYAICCVDQEIDDEEAEQVAFNNLLPYLFSPGGGSC